MDNTPMAARVNAALSALPWPCHLQMSPGTEDVYLAWYLLEERDILHASNAGRRCESVAQISIFSRQPVVDECDAVVRALKRAGLRVREVGPQGYDADTMYYLMPVIAVMARQSIT